MDRGMTSYFNSKQQKGFSSCPSFHIGIDNITSDGFAKMKNIFKFARLWWLT